MTITVISSNFFILILILMLCYILVVIHVAVIVAIIGSVISTCYHVSSFTLLYVDGAYCWHCHGNFERGINIGVSW